MAIKNRITEKNPRTGALPSEQTAENAGQKQGQSSGMLESDKLIYQLVENNVGYAGDQFGENLRFNSEVLTNVLYDNIYKLLGEKFEEDEFIKWVADELVNRGCVTKVEEPTQKEETSQVETEPKEEVVYELDDSEYVELQSKIGAAIELLKANKLNIFKAFNQINDIIGDVSTQDQSRQEQNHLLFLEQSQKINELVEKLQGNYDKLDEYVQSRKESTENIDKFMDDVQTSVSDGKAKKEKGDKVCKATYEKLDETLKLISGRAKQTNKDYQILDGKEFKSSLAQLQKLSDSKLAQKKEEQKSGIASTSLKRVLPPSSKQGGTTTASRQGKISPTSNLKPLQQQSRQGEARQNPISNSVKSLQKPKDEKKEVRESGRIIPEKKKTFGLGLFQKKSQYVKQEIQPENVVKKKKTFGFGLFAGKKNSRKKKGLVDLNEKKKKLPLGKRIKRGIARKIFRTKRKIKRAITENKIWKTLKTVTKVISKTLEVMKTVVSTVFKVGKKVAVAAYKTLKFGIKAFYKASKFVGKVMRKASTVMLNFAKKTIKTGGKNIVHAIRYGSGAKIMTFLGWKAIKFIGKSIWKGVKKLAVAGLGLLKKMFGLGGKLVNKIGTYIGKLGVGITDKTYRFLIKPMANFMVTMVGFAMGVVASPVQFMKHLIPTLLERLGNLVSNIKEETHRVLKATWGIFRKLLFNPFSLSLIIGGLFFFFWPKVIGWITGLVTGIRDKVIPAITKFCKRAVEIFAPVWDVMKTVGGWLFSLIKWITDPDNFIVRAIYWWYKIKFMLKKFIFDLMKASGQSTIDLLCRFIAGDTIGLAIGLIGGMLKKFWEFLKGKGVLKMVLRLVKFVKGIGKMIWDIPKRLGQSIIDGGSELIKFISTFGMCGSLSKVADAFTRPWKEWWDNLCGIFKSDEEPKSADEILEKNPIEENQSVSTGARNAVKSLTMKGLAGSATLDRLEEISRMKGYVGNQNFIRRIKQMEKLYQVNSNQVASYDKFLTGLWNLVDGSEEGANNAIHVLLESPDFSQKLMSVFYYHNPQTQQTMTLRPEKYIRQFVNNLQDLVVDGEGSWMVKFSTMVDAFDQMNKERSHIINNQGKQIKKFADDIANFNINQTNSDKVLEQMVVKFNKGDLFENISASSSFDQLKRGNAKTQNITGKSGKKLGSSNQIVQIKEAPQQTGGNGSGPQVKPALTKEDFTVHEPTESNMYGNIQMPKNLMPPRPLPEDADEDGRSKALVKKWKEQQETIRQLQNQELTLDEIKELGYEKMSFDEFKDRFHTTDEERVMDADYKERTMAGLRTAQAANDFNQQGTQLSENASMVMYYKPGGIPGTYNIKAQVNKDLYIFSDDWYKMIGASQFNDGDLAILMEQSNTEAMRKAQLVREQQIEEERQEQLDKEREQKREEEILNYSAKVNDGYIEIKLGEDTIAMEQAWYIHLDKRRAFLAQENHTPEMADEAGLISYSWEEWQKYYRRMNGMPEDGIKRIKFDGQRKERVIDWGKRKALTPDELGKYGITMSENGPVMIPLEKAMDATSSLLAWSMSIHSIRDGLEVMRYGLDSETEKLKKRREEGVPMVVVQNEPSQNESTVSTPSTPESQPES